MNNDNHTYQPGTDGDLSRAAAINRVHVKDFRSIAFADVQLGNLTVLAGPNGTGKSAFVDVLRFIADALSYGLDAAVTRRHGIAALRRWSSGRPHDLEIQITVSDHLIDGHYVIELGSGPRGTYKVKRESCRAATPRESGSHEIRNGKWLNYPHSSLDAPMPLAYPAYPMTLALALPTLTLSYAMFLMNRTLTHINAYSIVPQMLRAPQEPGNVEWLDENGRNVASILKEMKAANSAWLPRIASSLNKVIPEITDIDVKQVGGYLVMQFKHEVEGERSHWFDSAQESDGTLRLLGILTALYQDPPPTLVALEEPEVFIHPGALGVLCDVIREASTRTQILITTHSPELLSKFSADEIRVVERIKGRTEIGPITERQRDLINRKLFAPGELMLAEGLERETAGATP